jgi:hypothetical protein
MLGSVILHPIIQIQIGVHINISVDINPEKIT